MEKKLSVLGRVLFALPIAAFGVMHLANTEHLTSMVPGFLSWGARIFVIVSGRGLILAAVSVIVERPTRILAIFLGVMILTFAITIHLVKLIDGDPESLNQLFKDISLAGAAFYISANISPKRSKIAAPEKQSR